VEPVSGRQIRPFHKYAAITKRSTAEIQRCFFLSFAPFRRSIKSGHPTVEEKYLNADGTQVYSSAEMKETERKRVYTRKQYIRASVLKRHDYFCQQFALRTLGAIVITLI